MITIEDVANHLFGDSSKKFAEEELSRQLLKQEQVKKEILDQLSKYPSKPRQRRLF